MKLDASDSNFDMEWNFISIGICRIKMELDYFQTFAYFLSAPTRRARIARALLLVQWQANFFTRSIRELSTALTMHVRRDDKEASLNFHLLLVQPFIPRLLFYLPQRHLYWTCVVYTKLITHSSLSIY
jgi:hypothetical protein